jgi:hypothetical protein
VRRLKRPDTDNDVIEQRKRKTFGASNALKQAVWLNLAALENERLERGDLTSRTDTRWT